MMQTLLWMVIIPGIALPTEKQFKARIAELKPGQMVELKKLRERLGKPDHIARQILFRRSIVQWIYLRHPGWMIRLNCVQGKAPVVDRILSPIPRR